MFCILQRILSIVFFFFSSRRRHTRFDCDWSSDVCLPIFLDSAALRAHLVARGGQPVPLHADGKVVGEMITVRRPPGRTLADEEREVIRETLQQTRGRRADTARRLGISRTTLWRRLRAGVVGSRTA